MFCRLQVNSDADARFIALLRHSHVMPFLPLKGRVSEDGNARALFAVLQPLDGIAGSTLAHFSGAHERRAQYTEWDAAPDASRSDLVRLLDTKLCVSREFAK